MFSRLEKVGQGTYGVVYKARMVGTKEIVAVKQINLTSIKEGIPCTAIREIAVLNKLKNKNIVEVKKISVSSESVLIIFEYYQWDLKKYIKENDRMLKKNEIVSFSFQLLKAVEYMHSNSIVHRDIKPQNLLISSEKVLKVCDFGLARVANLPCENISLEVVTQWYRPPELLLGICSDLYAIDMWSVGCVIAEMASGYPLFPCSDDTTQLLEMFRMFGTPTELDWPGVWSLEKFPKDEPITPGHGLDDVLFKTDRAIVELIESLLVLNPASRLTASEALKLRVFDRIETLGLK